MASKEGHVTLNFHPIFLRRVRDYADKHGMKLNAVFKKAFELLEDYGLSSKPPVKAAVPMVTPEEDEDDAPPY